MQSARPVAPELHSIRYDAKAGPVWRPRDARSFEARGDLRHPALQISRLRHRATLVRGPRAKLARTRARCEIRVSLGVAGRLGAALDAYLNLHRRPVEAQRAVRVGEQFSPLASFVVGVEDEAALVERLEEHDSVGRAAVGSHSCQRHGVGIGEAFARKLSRCAREELREALEWFGERSYVSQEPAS